METIKSIAEVKKIIQQIAKKIGAKKEDVPTFLKSQDFGRPHIEIKNSKYAYVVIEKGHEISRAETSKLDELLYLVFFDITLSMATEFELQNRIPNQDSRKIIYKKQEEILGNLSTEWKIRCLEYNKNLQKNNPFDDSSLERALLYKELRERGHSEFEIETLVRKKFPE
jgi:hypothetical protein